MLGNYVVTPELAKNFDAALTFIRSALTGRTSKATFLHGSFGTGKNHFMAVLDQILEGNAAARGIPELAPVIQKHNEWLAGKKFLLVPYHMINSHDMESGVLGGYVDFMRQAAPGASVPPLYMSATIIAQARQERESYGDAPFFRRLNGGQDSTVAGGSPGWGELEATWDAASFEAAANSPPDSEAHLRLVSTLLKTVASSHAEVISHRGGNFVRFDKGLSIISQHAAGLGYDAVILFLDELILWLAMNSADLGFVKREAAKLTNLVEAQSADRPIPLISFVARQRDLRELIGDHVPGAERLSFGDALDWQGGRFDTITLEDRNLPAIAEKRVLKCRDEGAKKELDAAFEQTARMKDDVMSILLTQEGDRQMFRKVYPFSPALVQTLIAVSSVLQRERTALKVMMQLLVDHRETLRVGDVVPVGDLFDVVAHGDEAFILAAAEIATSEAAMGACPTKAAELDGNLETAGWDIFEALGKLIDDRQQAAQEIPAELREALSSDEHVVGLAAALTSAQARAVRLLTKPVEQPKSPIVIPPTPHQPPPPPPPTPGWKVVDEGAADGLDLGKAKDKLAALERKLRGDRRIQVQISWRIEEKKG